MRHLASFAAAIAVIVPLTAEAADAARTLGGNAPSPLLGSSRLPLDAMRHHQPRAADVARREADSGNKDEDLRRRNNELDALYNDIMARSAPAK